MRNTLRLLHLLGFVAFAGSSASWLVLAAAAGGASPANLVFAREVIDLGLLWLTVPGMWLAVLVGATIAQSGWATFGDRWVLVKTAAAIVMVINTHMVLLPTAGEAVELARIAQTQGGIPADYHEAAATERVAGALNLVLALVAAVSGLWKYGRRRRRAVPSG